MGTHIIVLTAFMAVLGAAAASFTNTAALRKAGGESFVKGRSRCPGCGESLRWFELIPIVSWLIQAGRCRRCKASIPLRYLIVELIGALVSALCFLRYEISPMTPLAFCVAFILMAVALVDYATMEIPNGLVFALIPLAAAALWAQPEVSILARGIGLAAVSLPMLVLSLIVDDAFGGGDIKLMAACGFLLGWQNTLLAFLIALIFGGILSASLIISKKAKKGTHIAFGPFLCAGVTAALLYGTQIIEWYLRLFGIYL